MGSNPREARSCSIKRDSAALKTVSNVEITIYLYSKTLTAIHHQNHTWIILQWEVWRLYCQTDNLQTEHRFYLKSINKPCKGTVHNLSPWGGGGRGLKDFGWITIKYSIDPYKVLQDIYYPPPPHYQLIWSQSLYSVSGDWPPFLSPSNHIIPQNPPPPPPHPSIPHPHPPIPPSLNSHPRL